MEEDKDKRELMMSTERVEISKGGRKRRKRK